MMYPPQTPFPPQQPTGTAPFSTQTPFPPQQPTNPAPFSPQTPFPPQQSTSTAPFSTQTPFPPQQPTGSAPFSPQQPQEIISYSPQDSFSQQNSYILSETCEEPHNLPAKRAIINGIIALVLSLFTLFTLAGFTGLITGTLALVYGFMGLRTAKQLPNNMGRGLAIIGIALGSIAWLVVLLLLILRMISP